MPTLAASSAPPLTSPAPRTRSPPPLPLDPAAPIPPPCSLLHRLTTLAPRCRRSPRMLHRAPVARRRSLRLCSYPSLPSDLSLCLLLSGRACFVPATLRPLATPRISRPSPSAPALPHRGTPALNPPPTLPRLHRSALSLRPLSPPSPLPLSIPAALHPCLPPLPHRNGYPLPLSYPHRRASAP